MAFAWHKNYLTAVLNKMTLNWHITQSIHNKEVSDFLNKETPAYIDWEITSLFYSALHLVNGYCKKNQLILPSTHRKRNPFIKKNLPSAYVFYKKLFDLSMKSGYTVGIKMNSSSLGIAKNNYSALQYALS